MLLATGVLAAACGACGARAHDEPDQAGSVPACTATAVRGARAPRHADHPPRPLPRPEPGPAESGPRPGHLRGRRRWTAQGSLATPRRHGRGPPGQAHQVAAAACAPPRPVPPPPPAAPAAAGGRAWPRSRRGCSPWASGPSCWCPGSGAAACTRRGPGAAGPVPWFPSGTRARLAPVCWPGSPTWSPGGAPGLAGGGHPAGGHRARHGHADRVDGPGVPPGAGVQYPRPSAAGPGRRTVPPPRRAGPAGTCGSSSRSCTAWRLARRSCSPCSPW